MDTMVKALKGATFSYTRSACILAGIEWACQDSAQGVAQGSGSPDGSLQGKLPVRWGAVWNL